MARPLRLAPPGGVHHIGHHVQAERRLWPDDGHREAFGDRCREAAERHGVRFLALCLMDTHYHALLEDPRGALSAAMHHVHAQHASWHNRTARRAGQGGARGALWAGRFWSSLVQTDRYLWMTARYIARNPVEAGLCTDPADWRWSSHRLVVTGEADPLVDTARLLSFFDGGRDAYLGWVQDAARPELTIEHVGVSGDHAFARRHLPPARPSDQVPRRFLDARRPPLASLLAGAADERTGACAARAAGYRFREIAEALDRPLPTVASWWRRVHKNQT